jgi:hypothetical protein
MSKCPLITSMSLLTKAQTRAENMINQMLADFLQLTSNLVKEANRTLLAIFMKAFESFLRAFDPCRHLKSFLNKLPPI